MFFHRNMATHGLFPGIVSTRSIANLGHFEIEVIVTEEGAGGGGGSIAAHPGIYVPWKGKPQQRKKSVQIVVKFSKDQVWRRAYVIDSRGADMLVKVINIVNAATVRLSVAVSHIQRAARRVTAVFSRTDK